MDFSLNEDQQAFADSAQALFADYCSDEALRLHDAGTAPYMSDLWAQCMANGLHSILISESAGGLGLGMTELGAVLEQQGRALALVPLAEHQLVASTLERYADAAAVPVEGGPSVSGMVAQAAQGEVMLSLSLTALQEASGPRMQAHHAGSSVVLAGGVHAVAFGAQADAVLVPVNLDGVWRLALISKSMPGVSVTAGRSQHHLEVADFKLQDVRIPESHLLDVAALPWLESHHTACVAATQMGVSAAQLQRTVEYVSQRKQFGRAIGTFQLVAGQMADAQILLEALRSSYSQLVYRLDAGLGCGAQSLAVKVLAAQAAHFIGHKAQHVHGGMGVDITYPIHRYLYWSRMLSASLGGSEASLERLGHWLAENDALGWKYDLPEDAGTPAGQGAHHAA